MARKPQVSRAEARGRLGLTDGRLALISFGGLGLPGFDPSVLGQVKGWEFLLTGIETGGPANATGWPANATGFDVDRADALGLGYVDLVGAVDVCVTKPGYGIVSDAIGARTRMVYTERGDFPEYPVLVGQMARWLPSRHVTNADLRAGRLQDALEAVMADPFPPAPDTSGAEHAARRLLAA